MLKSIDSKYRIADLHDYPTEVFKAVLCNVTKIRGLNSLKNNDVNTIKQIATFLYGNKDIANSDKYNLEKCY